MGTKTAAANMRSACTALTDTFTEGQSDKASYPYMDAERVYWYYAPINRHGLPLRDMSESQQHLTYQLMKTGLSEEGNKRAVQIIDHEQILGIIEKETKVIMWERDPQLYFFTVFGDPESDQPWGWRIEGHHLSLHFSIWKDDIISSTPFFFGANPAEVQKGPKKGLRILGPREDLALELMANLSPSQIKKALIFDEAPADILTFSAARASLPYEEGLPASQMDKTQLGILSKLISEYIGQINEDLSSVIETTWQEKITGIHLAWGGAASAGKPHYYRLHGGTFLAEYDNRQNDANHIHSVWRDTDNDFAVDVLRDHLLLYHIM